MQNTICFTECNFFRPQKTAVHPQKSLRIVPMIIIKQVFIVT